MKDAVFSFLISSSSGVATQVPISQQQQFTPCFRALKQAKHMVPFYCIWISNTQFDWRDCQMMTWRGHFKNTVFSSSMDTTPLNDLGYLLNSYFRKPSNSPIAQEVAVISFCAFVLKPQLEVKTASLGVSSLPFSCKPKSQELPSLPLQAGFLTPAVYLIYSVSSFFPCYLSPSS